METLTYLKRKVVATAFRQLLAAAHGDASTTHDEILQIPSRDGESRTIEVYHYRNKSQHAPAKRPILINSHGGGFLLGKAGSDDAFCSKICTETEYEVFDVDYRLAPEHVYPNGLNDVHDVVQWVLDHSDQYDTSRIAVSGFSAGGNFALATSLSFPVGTIEKVVAFYPVVDLHTSPYEKIAPENKKGVIPPYVASIFDEYYLSPQTDTKDPLVSPLFAKSENFPNKTFFVTCGIDSLHDEGTALAKRIQEANGKTCTLKQVPHVSHAWDKQKWEEGSIERRAIDETYEMSVRFLSES